MSSKHWHASKTAPDRIRVARVEDLVATLGPGARNLVVVQGCHLRCHGCIATETHDLGAGTEMSIDQLVDRLSQVPAEGITFSGGEPFVQAAAVGKVIDALRELRPGFSAMSFSGYRVEVLLRDGNPDQRALLGKLDLLVDGPYVERWHRPLKWRASTNQRLLALTDKHRDELEDDSSAGVEVRISEDLEARWDGVPPHPGFLSRIDALSRVEADLDLLDDLDMEG